MRYLHYIVWDVKSLDKPEPIEDVLALYGHNVPEFEANKETVKKKIKSGEWDVVNLQLTANDKLVRRNPVDSPIGQRETKIIMKNLSDLCSMYNKLPGVHARCKEMRLDINNNSFIAMGRSEIVCGDKGVDLDVCYSIADGYYVFISTKSGVMDALEGTPRIEDVISFIKDFIKINIGVSFQGTNIESGITAYISSFSMDSTGSLIKPKILVVKGPDTSCKDFLNYMSQLNLCTEYKMNNDNLCLKLSLGEKGLPTLLKLCNKFGSRLQVNGNGEEAHNYMREINNYYNKKACAIRADGVLKIV